MRLSLSPLITALDTRSARSIGGDLCYQLLNLVAASRKGMPGLTRSDKHILKARCATSILSYLSYGGTGLGWARLVRRPFPMVFRLSVCQCWF